MCIRDSNKTELDTNIGSKVVLQENLDDALAYKKAMGEKYGGRSIRAHMRATFLSLVYALSETSTPLVTNPSVIESIKDPIDQGYEEKERYEAFQGRLRERQVGLEECAARHS